MSETEYRFTIRPLTAEEGGGYLIEFPDRPGCMSDGETIEQAIANGVEAKRDWIAAMRQAGRPVPPPTAESAEAYSGKWVLRTPKSLHRSLAERARREGGSLNARRNSRIRRMRYFPIPQGETGKERSARRSTRPAGAGGSAWR